MDSAVKFIREKIKDIVPDIALVLGSGLGDFTDGMDGISIPYQDIEGFMPSTVEGHKGSLFFYDHKGKSVAIMQGRLHMYEGHTMDVVTYPIKILKKLGITKLILTNACGAINPELTPGDLILIKDHINNMGSNPLIGPNDDTMGTRFPDMSEVYSKELRKTALLCAEKNDIDLQEGVYVGIKGPSYETPSEIKMLRLFGADVVGMSTVPEAIVANWAGIKVLGISLVTNYGAGIRPGRLSHKEVIGAGKIAGSKVKKLLLSILDEI